MKIKIFTKIVEIFTPLQQHTKSRLFSLPRTLRIRFSTLKFALYILMFTLVLKDGGGGAER